MLNATSRRRTQLILGLILVLYLGLAFGYGLANPLFEAPDEQHHFFTARYIAQAKRLPDTHGADALLRQEAAQPPLYYLLAAPLIAAVDTQGAESSLWANPTVRIGYPMPINANAYVHSGQEAWPWQGYALAAHLVRGLSALLGLGTLFCIFGAGRSLWPADAGPALLATALVAFLPQFAFLHGAISNDVLIIFLTSLALLQLLHLWVSGLTTVRLILLGVTIGLAVLSKMAGLLLLPLAALVLLLRTWGAARGGEEANASWWRNWLLALALVAVPALLISGWLLWRNWSLYGDPTASNQFVALAGGDRGYTLRQVWSDLDRVLQSAVAFFGWMNVQPPRWLYAVWAGIVLLAAGGWLSALWSGRSAAGDRAGEGSRSLAALWLAVWVLLVGAAWLRFMLQTPADQGRLLFPALLPLALFLGRGIWLLRQRWLPWAAALAALLTSLYAVLVVIPGAYNMAWVLAEGEIPPPAARLDADMGAGITLVAVEPLTRVIEPGEWAWVDLYWRADRPPDVAPLAHLELYGRENAPAGRQINYHGGGNFPASEWPAGGVVRDRLGVQLQEGAALPAQMRLLLHLDEGREPVEIARVKAGPRQWPEVEGEPLATIGGGIDLLSTVLAPATAEPGGLVALDLRWHVRDGPRQALTTFVHLGHPAAPPLAQGDAPPLAGAYPSDLWEAGEVFDDHYELLLPDDLVPGTYPVHIGLYESAGGRRLPVSAGGQPQPYEAFLVGTVTVEPPEGKNRP